jgi:hypothetical protein
MERKRVCGVGEKGAAVGKKKGKQRRKRKKLLG